MQYIVPYKFIYNSYSDDINFYMIFLFRYNWNDAKGKTLSLLAKLRADRRNNSENQSRANYAF